MAHSSYVPMVTVSTTIMSVMGTMTVVIAAMNCTVVSASRDVSLLELDTSFLFAANTLFMCGDGSCILSYLECNSVDNCGDCSDELHCGECHKRCFIARARYIIFICS